MIDGGPDRDIADNIPMPGAVAALAAMKAAEPSFNVTEFLQGARWAYEMILMAFDKGEIDRIRPFLADEVAATFAAAIADRQDRGLTIDSTFSGVRELALTDATFDPTTKTAEVSVRFTGELSRVVRNKAGAVDRGQPDRDHPPTRHLDLRPPHGHGRSRTGNSSPPATDPRCAPPCRILLAWMVMASPPATAQVLDFEELDGWVQDDHLAALQTFRASAT